MSAHINDGGSAFPLPGFPFYVDGIPQPLSAGYGWGEEPKYGMTLRDWFAGMALQGELASTAGVESTQAMAEASVDKGREPLTHLALTCYEIADAMIKARNSKPAA